MTDRDKPFLERWFEEAWNKGRVEAIDEMVAEDVIAYGLTDEQGNAVTGINEFKRFHQKFRSAFPDINVTVEKIVTEGNMTAAVCRVRGTHKGQGVSLEPTGNGIDFSGILMVRLRDGKIVEAWNYFDFLTMFAQLGALSLNLQQE